MDYAYQLDISSRGFYRTSTDQLAGEIGGSKAGGKIQGGSKFGGKIRHDRKMAGEKRREQNGARTMAGEIWRERKGGIKAGNAKQIRIRSSMH